MTSPTQRSLEYMRGRGCVCQVVEKWNPHARIRQDLFGGIDILCLWYGTEGYLTMDPPIPVTGGVTIGVQATSDSNVAARVTKLLAEPRMKLWVQCGNQLIVHGWAKKARPWKDGEKRSGVRAKRWTLRVVHLYLEMFPACFQPTPDV